jgi:hypothetical protein
MRKVFERAINGNYMVTILAQGTQGTLNKCRRVIVKNNAPDNPCFALFVFLCHIAPFP